HPFVRGLMDGSLPRESFEFYAVQDALYLREFARALSLVAARASEDSWIIMFNEHAAGALKVERALHESFFKEFGMTPDAVAATNRVAVRLSAAERHAMIRHFVTTSRYEWMFWEMGYRREAWPL